jgi:hypothetical protein
MFEKITDFDGKQFLNLWGGFSCECFADGINTFVMFYIKDEEVLSLSGNGANDVLDFVLSEYYENENSTIEDGFSTWLMGHYDNVMPTFGEENEKEETLTTDDIPLSVLYKTLLKDCKRQDRIIEKQKKEIKKLKDKVDKYSIKNYEMRKQLERYGVTTEKGENLHKIIIDLNRAVQKRNDKINKLQMRINELSSSV